MAPPFPIDPNRRDDKVGDDGDRIAQDQPGRQTGNLGSNVIDTPNPRVERQTTGEDNCAGPLAGGGLPRQEQKKGPVDG
jgi:hypothetical protein